MNFLQSVEKIIASHIVDSNETINVAVSGGADSVALLRTLHMLNRNCIAIHVNHKLRGKDKPTFTPHVDGGDFVVVINAEKLKVTGNKADQKKYYKHSLYPGGLKERSYKEVLENNPERIIENAVKGMLPKNKLGKSMIKKLKVYRGAEHPHQSQNPSEWNPKL